MAHNFSIESYNYTLPDEKIARFPLAERDSSKLLLWKKGHISHHVFRELPDILPADALLIFNDTRVIAARLHFKKDSGANIEVFLLHPQLPSRDIAGTMTMTEPVVWQCLIGNKKRWKDGTLTKNLGETMLTVAWYDRENDLVKLSWSGYHTFAEIINLAGETPLPPYLHRQAQRSDASHYQTVYSTNEGAVAAPTAGLHFTKNLLEQIKQHGRKTEYLTLHVSAGTFRPVETEDFRMHQMHTEQVLIQKSAVENIMKHEGINVAVGTTSLRILESLHWFGELLCLDPKAEFKISQTLPYELESKLTFRQSLEIIHEHMGKNKLSTLHGETGIFIYPPYQVRSARGLITNYHLPKSTLLLLIAAFTDNDWKAIYEEAINENYRFLSYGDSSLLML